MDDLKFNQNLLKTPVIIDGRDYSLADLISIVHFVKDFAQLAEWEVTMKAQDLQSKAFTLVARSRR